jgi:predicted glycosyltransferase involved in capsule biosynthesis
MKKLTNTTFIIPVKIEHNDRYRNAKTVLNYLNQHFITQVFIYEISSLGETQTELNFLCELKNLAIKHWIGNPEPTFHRTKYLNIMLNEVQTPVVANYDIDVILSPNNYIECQEEIMSGKAEVIYPYELGMGQIQIFPTFNYKSFEESGYNLDVINQSSEKKDNISECGHCVFLKTSTYKKLGGENENFISYGPEDKERMHRFKKSTNSVFWRSGEKVYHFEHHRGNDSNENNLNFEHNWRVYRDLEKMTQEELLLYYKNQDYLKKYSNF